MSKLYLVTNIFDKIRALIVPILDGKIDYCVISNEQEFYSIENKIHKSDILFSYSHSIIIPYKIINRFKIAVNVHAAPPEYPGRDVQHFAAYDEVTKYGATLHKMIGRVDAGDILDVEYFKINKKDSPQELHRLANDAACKLVFRNLPRIIQGDELIPIPLKWGLKKTTRKMFTNMCTIDQTMPENEVKKRIEIFHVHGYRNIKINIHGYWFYYFGNEEK